MNGRQKNQRDAKRHGTDSLAPSRLHHRYHPSRVLRFSNKPPRRLARSVVGPHLATGIETDARGAIRVGPDMATTRPGVWAAGDVTDRDQFVYMAAYGAKVAVNNALGLEPMVYDNAAMPWAVFTDPQVAGVGLSEAQARAAGFEVKTSTLTLDNVPRAAAARDVRGVIKLVADAKTDRLLGGQIAAPEGADSIQTLAMALKAGMTTKELGATIFPYLTTVEGLKLAAQTFDKDVAKLSCCAG